MNKHSITHDAALFFLRLPLGLYLAVAGLNKAQGEIKEKLGHFYEGSFTRLKPAWLPDAFAVPYGYALPWLEMIVGAAIILGLFTRLASVIGLLMLVSFTLALALFFETIKAQPDAANHPFNGNYIQITAYLLLALLGPGRWAVDLVLFRKKKG